jgi:hypothetical protein
MINVQLNELVYTLAISSHIQLYENGFYTNFI